MIITLVKKFLLPLLFFIFPSSAFAAFGFGSVDIFDVAHTLLRIIYRTISGVVFLVIIFAFFWGLGIFVLNTQDPKKLEEGKKWMLWAVIAMFVAITFWGIVWFLVYTLGAPPIIIPHKG